MTRTRTGFQWWVSDDIGAARLPIEARVEFPDGGGGGILIRPEPDMGDAATKKGYGFPIIIERYEGETRLLIWADINQEDPTHTISLEGARERARR